MNDTLTLKEIARHLDRPPSTVRSWRDTFEDYLPVQGEGRARRYPREAVPVFETIAAAYAQGLDTNAVEAQLNAAYPKAVTFDVSANPDDPNAANAATNAAVTQAFQQGQEALVLFTYLETQRQALEDARQDIEELRQALAETAAARDEAQAALANAVTAKELAAQARETARQAQEESAQREEQLKAWIEERMTAAERRRSLADRVRRMLRGDRR